MNKTRNYLVFLAGIIVLFSSFTNNLFGALSLFEILISLVKYKQSYYLLHSLNFILIPLIALAVLVLQTLKQKLFPFLLSIINCALIILLIFLHPFVESNTKPGVGFYFIIVGAVLYISSFFFFNRDNKNISKSKISKTRKNLNKTTRNFIILNLILCFLYILSFFLCMNFRNLLLSVFTIQIVFTILFLLFFSLDSIIQNIDIYKVSRIISTIVVQFLILSNSVLIMLLNKTKNDNILFAFVLLSTVFALMFYVPIFTMRKSKNDNKINYKYALALIFITYSIFALVFNVSDMLSTTGWIKQKYNITRYILPYFDISLNINHAGFLWNIETGKNITGLKIHTFLSLASILYMIFLALKLLKNIDETKSAIYLKIFFVILIIHGILCTIIKINIPAFFLIISGSTGIYTYTNLFKKSKVS